MPLGRVPSLARSPASVLALPATVPAGAGVLHGVVRCPANRASVPPSVPPPRSPNSREGLASTESGWVVPDQSRMFFAAFSLRFPQVRGLRSQSMVRVRGLRIHVVPYVGKRPVIGKPASTEVRGGARVASCGYSTAKTAPLSTQPERRRWLPGKTFVVGLPSSSRTSCRRSLPRRSCACALSRATSLQATLDGLPGPVPRRVAGHRAGHTAR